MTDPNLYRMLDGEPVISVAGMSLLTGIPEDQIRRAIAKGEPGQFVLPAAWIKNGIRRRKEAAAALGHEPSMTEAIEYWQARGDGNGRPA